VCITDSVEINTEGFLCENSGENVVLAKPNILSASSCHSLCFSTPSPVFTWHHLCFLYNASHVKQTGWQGCFSAAGGGQEKLLTSEDQQFIAINDTQEDIAEDTEEDLSISNITDSDATEVTDDWCVGYNYTELSEEDRNLSGNKSDSCTMYCDGEDTGQEIFWLIILLGGTKIAVVGLWAGCRGSYSWLQRGRWT